MTPARDYNQRVANEFYWVSREFALITLKFNWGCPVLLHLIWNKNV